MDSERVSIELIKVAKDLLAADVKGEL